MNEEIIYVITKIDGKTIETVKATLSNDNRNLFKDLLNLLSKMPQASDKLKRLEKIIAEN